MSFEGITYFPAKLTKDEKDGITHKKAQQMVGSMAMGQSNSTLVN